MRLGYAKSAKTKMKNTLHTAGNAKSEKLIMTENILHINSRTSRRRSNRSSQSSAI